MKQGGIWLAPCNYGPRAGASGQLNQQYYTLRPDAGDYRVQEGPLGTLGLPSEELGSGPFRAPGCKLTPYPALRDPAYVVLSLRQALPPTIHSLTPCETHCCCQLHQNFYCAWGAAERTGRYLEEDSAQKHHDRIDSAGGWVHQTRSRCSGSPSITKSGGKGLEG